MEFADILNLIGSYAFPITMCIAFFWKVDKDEAARREEQANMTEAINNNTLTMQKLIDKLEAKA